MQFLKGLEVRIRRLRNRLAPLIYAGDNLYCPVCARSFSKFRTAGRGTEKRDNAVCPLCTSRERDRLSFLFFSDATSGCFGPDTRLLHIAPEPCLLKPFRELAAGAYVCADLMRTDVDERFDVMAIPHPDATFTAVYCSHVLQDVRDDTKAMAEFYRVLAPGGWAILNVPVTTATSVDHRDAPKHVRATADDRPPEHLRSYGLDYPRRMESVGFQVRVIAPDDLASAQEQQRMGIATAASGAIYFGIKPAGDASSAPSSALGP